jgi:hypothetical protein
VCLDELCEVIRYYRLWDHVDELSKTSNKALGGIRVYHEARDLNKRARDYSARVYVINVHIRYGAVLMIYYRTRYILQCAKLLAARPPLMLRVRPSAESSLINSRRCYRIPKCMREDSNSPFTLPHH